MHLAGNIVRVLHGTFWTYFSVRCAWESNRFYRGKLPPCVPFLRVSWNSPSIMWQWPNSAEHSIWKSHHHGKTAATVVVLLPVLRRRLRPLPPPSRRRQIPVSSSSSSRYNRVSSCFLSNRQPISWGMLCSNTIWTVLIDVNCFRLPVNDSREKSGVYRCFPVEHNTGEINGLAWMYFRWCWSERWADTICYQLLGFLKKICDILYHMLPQNNNGRVYNEPIMDTWIKTIEQFKSRTYSKDFTFSLQDCSLS